MADAGPPAPLVPPALQAPEQPLQPIQLPVPNQSVPTQQIQHIPQLNWSHFKTEFLGNPEGD